MALFPFPCFPLFYSAPSPFQMRFFPPQSLLSPPPSSLFHPFVWLCVSPSPACLQNSCAQTQQMLKGKTGTTLDAISILLKDH